MADPIGSSFVPSGSTKVSGVEYDTYEGAVHAVRYTEIPSNMQLRAAYSSTDGLPDYTGFAPRGLASSASGWLLQKFTYDGNRQCTLRQIAYGIWDNRASETYA